jgi:hypothetical protein
MRSATAEEHCHMETTLRSGCFTAGRCKTGLCSADVCSLLTGHRNHLCKNSRHYSPPVSRRRPRLSIGHLLCRHYRHHRRLRPAADGCSRISDHIRPSCTGCRRHSLSDVPCIHHSCRYPHLCRYFGRRREPRSTVYEHIRSSGYIRPRCRRCHRHN